MNAPNIRKALSFLLSVVYFTTQVVLASATETNMWSERRRALKPTQVAALPSSLNPMASPETLLKQLPQINSSLSLKPGWTNPTKRASRISPSLQNILGAIPQTAAQVQDIYSAPASPKTGFAESSPVVLIQDVHLNTEAQSNISTVLQELIDKKQVGAVGVEGSFTKFDFAQYRKYENKALTKAIVDDMVRQNLLAAPSYVGITSAVEPPHFIGVDDKTHYDANLEALYAARDQKESVTKQLSAIKKEIEARKETIFSKDLYDFDQLRSAYHQGSVGFGSYLKKMAGYTSNLDFTVEQFLEAYDMESKLDFKRIETERRTVIEKLTKTLNESEISELVAQSVAYRMGKLSFGTYYQDLKNLCEQKDVHLRQTPNFHNYIRYVLLSDGIKADALFNAIEKMESDITDDLARTPEEKSLVTQSEWVLLAEKLIDFSLTPKEWNKYQKITKNKNPRTNPSDLKSFEQFYIEADIRSEKMVENLLKPIINHQASNLNPSIESLKLEDWNLRAPKVLVLGGFHSPHVAQLLREKNISYITVSPKLTKVDDTSGSAYLSVFQRDKTPLDRLFAGEKLFVYPTHVAVTNPATSNLTQGVLEAEHRTGRAERGDYRFIPAALGKKGKTGIQIHNTLVAPIRETLILATIITGIKAAFGPMLFQNPTSLSLHAWLILLIIGVGFSFAHSDLWNKSTYKGGFTFSKFISRFLLRTTGGGFFTWLLLLPNGFVLSWMYHMTANAIYQLGVALNLPLIDSYVRPFSIGSIEPKQIFIILPEHFFPILETLPTPSTEIPQNFTTDPTQATETDMLLVFQNNGFLKINKRLSYEKLGDWLNTNMRNLGERVSIYDFATIVASLPEDAKVKLGLDKVYTDEVTYDFEKPFPILSGVTYQGRTYSLGEFRRESPTLFSSHRDDFRAISFEGPFLYRAIRGDELEKIKNRKYYLIQKETNFQENIGNQVIHFSKEEGYSGVTIRIPVKGPYFRPAGLQVPRITSFAPHFIDQSEIMVMKQDENQNWHPIPMADYLRSSGSQSSIIEPGDSPENRATLPIGVKIAEMLAGEKGAQWYIRNAHTVETGLAALVVASYSLLVSNLTNSTKNLFIPKYIYLIPLLFGFVFGLLHLPGRFWLSKYKITPGAHSVAVMSISHIYASLVTISISWIYQRISPYIFLPSVSSEMGFLILVALVWAPVCLAHRQFNNPNEEEESEVELWRTIATPFLVVGLTFIMTPIAAIVTGLLIERVLSHFTPSESVRTEDLSQDSLRRELKVRSLDSLAATLILFTFMALLSWLSGQITVKGDPVQIPTWLVLSPLFSFLSLVFVWMTPILLEIAGRHLGETSSTRRHIELLKFRGVRIDPKTIGMELHQSARGTWTPFSRRINRNDKQMLITDLSLSPALATILDPSAKGFFRKLLRSVSLALLGLNGTAAILFSFNPNRKVEEKPLLFSAILAIVASLGFSVLVLPIFGFKFLSEPFVWMVLGLALISVTIVQFTRERQSEFNLYSRVVRRPSFVGFASATLMAWGTGLRDPFWVLGSGVVGGVFGLLITSMVVLLRYQDALSKTLASLKTSQDSQDVMDQLDFIRLLLSYGYLGSSITAGEVAQLEVFLSHPDNNVRLTAAETFLVLMENPDVLSRLPSETVLSLRKSLLRIVIQNLEMIESVYNGQRRSTAIFLRPLLDWISLPGFENYFSQEHSDLLNPLLDHLVRYSADVRPVYNNQNGALRHLAGRTKEEWMKSSSGPETFEAFQRLADSLHEMDETIQNGNSIGQNDPAVSEFLERDAQPRSSSHSSFLGNTMMMRSSSNRERSTDEIRDKIKNVLRKRTNDSGITIELNTNGRFRIQSRSNSSKIGVKDPARYQNFLRTVELTLDMVFETAPKEELLQEARALPPIRRAVGYHAFEDVPVLAVLGDGLTEPLHPRTKNFFLGAKDGERRRADYIDSDLLRDLVRVLGTKSGATVNLISTVIRYLDLVEMFETTSDRSILDPAVGKLVNTYKFSRAVAMENREMGRVKIFSRVENQWYLDQARPISSLNPTQIPFRVVDPTVLETPTPAGFMAYVQAEMRKFERKADNAPFFIFHKIYEWAGRSFLLVARDGRFELIYTSLQYSEVAGTTVWELQEAVLGGINSEGQLGISWFAKPIYESLHELPEAALHAINLNVLSNPKMIVDSSGQEIIDLHLQLGLVVGWNGKFMSMKDEGGRNYPVEGNPHGWEVHAQRYSNEIWRNIKQPDIPPGVEVIDQSRKLALMGNVPTSRGGTQSSILYLLTHLIFSRAFKMSHEQIRSSRWFWVMNALGVLSVVLEWWGITSAGTWLDLASSGLSDLLLFGLMVGVPFLVVHVALRMANPNFTRGSPFSKSTLARLAKASLGDIFVLSIYAAFFTILPSHILYAGFIHAGIDFVRTVREWKGQLQLRGLISKHPALKGESPLWA